MKYEDTGVPLRPKTPQALGCSSEICPFPLKVVMIGHRRRSTSSTTFSILNLAPWPTTITGLVDFSIKDSALS